MLRGVATLAVDRIQHVRQNIAFAEQAAQLQAQQQVPMFQAQQQAPLFQAQHQAPMFQTQQQAPMFQTQQQAVMFQAQQQAAPPLQMQQQSDMRLNMSEEPFYQPSPMVQGVDREIEAANRAHQQRLIELQKLKAQGASPEVIAQAENMIELQQQADIQRISRQMYRASNMLMMQHNTACSVLSNFRV
ncbi:hypothetical protein BGZ81_007917 [Podila clonocystis]|nr:hypothetical protein BGZ81_007917 [Podila clonocystis]